MIAEIFCEYSTEYDKVIHKINSRCSNIKLVRWKMIEPRFVNRVEEIRALRELRRRESLGIVYNYGPEGNNLQKPSLRHLGHMYPP